MSEFVWNAAALEGNTYTLPEVQTLLDEGASVSGKPIEEADQILALRDGVRLMTSKVHDGSFRLSKETSDEVHGLAARHEAIESGAFRGEGSVSGGGTVRLADGGSIQGDTIGEDRTQLLTDYANLLSTLSMMSDPRERALAYFCSATRSQFYFDGNKRTARIMMAGELLAHSYEAVSVPFARRLEYNQALDVLFRGDDATDLMEFLTTCVA